MSSHTLRARRDVGDVVVLTPQVLKQKPRAKAEPFGGTRRWLVRPEREGICRSTRPTRRAVLVCMRARHGCADWCHIAEGAGGAVVGKTRRAFVVPLGRRPATRGDASTIAGS